MHAQVLARQYCWHYRDFEAGPDIDIPDGGDMPSDTGEIDGLLKRTCLPGYLKDDISSEPTGSLKHPSCALVAIRTLREV